MAIIDLSIPGFTWDDVTGTVFDDTGSAYPLTGIAELWNAEQIAQHVVYVRSRPVVPPVEVRLATVEADVAELDSIIVAVLS